MGAAPEQHDGTVDADLVAAQFDVLDSDTHRKALLEALRARDAYRKLIEQLEEKIAKLEQGLIGPKSERYKGEDGEVPQLSLQVLSELLGQSQAEGANIEQLAAALLAQADAEVQADAGDSGGGGDDGDEPLHRRKSVGRIDRRKNRRKAKSDDTSKPLILLRTRQDSNLRPSA